jgi:hypothetical protein
LKKFLRSIRRRAKEIRINKRPSGIRNPKNDGDLEKTNIIIMPQTPNGIIKNITNNILNHQIHFFLVRRSKIEIMKEIKKR